MLIRKLRNVGSGSAFLVPKAFIDTLGLTKQTLFDMAIRDGMITFRPLTAEQAQGLKPDMLSSSAGKANIIKHLVGEST
jgi:hypothetical protein